MSFLDRLFHGEADDSLPPEFTGIVADRWTPSDADGDNGTLAIQFPEEAVVPGPRYGQTSGLRGHRLIAARDMTMQGAWLAYHHRESVHYTEGSSRWDGISNYRRAWRGQYPHWADCSSFVTWCLWQGLLHFHVGDVVNGQHFRGGYTGTMLGHGARVYGGMVRGDAVIYGRGFPGSHTALYVGSGMVMSHGSERGPLFIPMRYRSDILGVRRYL